MSPLRIWLVGFGMVGRWLAGARDAQAGRIAARYGRTLTVTGVGNSRDGFVYHPDGLDLASILAAAAAGRPITDQPGARVWPSAIEELMRFESPVTQGFRHVVEDVELPSGTMTASRSVSK